MGNCQHFKSKEDPIKPQFKKGQHSGNILIIKSYTWPRDSHGLFDYESKKIIKEVVKMTKSGFLIRHNNDFRINNDIFMKIKNDPNLKQLGFILEKNNNYWLHSNQMIENQNIQEDKKQDIDGLNENSIWLVIKSLKANKENKSYILHEGDYIKLGRVRFRIKSCVRKQQEKIQSNSNVEHCNDDKKNQIEIKKSSLVNEILKSEDKISETQSAKLNQIVCRICLSETEDQNNPFVTPCLCAGTMKYIHIDCLQKWLKSRLQCKESEICVSVAWKNFECELCKFPYPNQLNFKGKSFDVVEIPKPFEGPYIILEVLSRDKNQCRGLHIINLAQKQSIKMGRGHDSDIRITDISVSRCHAQLKYANNEFVLEDNDSKFGTLALMRDSLEISQNNNNFAIQIGRTVLYFTLKKKWKVFNAFMKGSNEGLLTQQSTIQEKKKIIGLNNNINMNDLNENNENDMEINNQIQINPDNENNNEENVSENSLIFQNNQNENNNSIDIIDQNENNDNQENQQDDIDENQFEQQQQQPEMNHLNEQELEQQNNNLQEEFSS